MRRSAQVPLARMTFPLTLAEGLRTAFADFVSDPLPERLAALMRQLRTDCEERLGEANHGASATETSRRIEGRLGAPGGVRRLFRRQRLLEWLLNRVEDARLLRRLN